MSTADVLILGAVAGVAGCVIGAVVGCLAILIDCARGWLRRL